MYCPAHFEESRTEVMHALITSRPLATLVTMTSNGLNADHIPLLLSADGSCLQGHIARANPMWKTVRTDIEALAVFHGPAAYISPAWYPTKQETGKAVPTWNYVTVHAHGTLHIIEDREWLRQQISTLTTQQEKHLPEPWAVTDAPTDYIEQMLSAVVGIELRISRLLGKWKVSQNQPERNRSGAAQGLQALDTEDARRIAHLIAGSEATSSKH